MAMKILFQTDVENDRGIRANSFQMCQACVDVGALRKCFWIALRPALLLCMTNLARPEVAVMVMDLDFRSVFYLG